MELIEKELKTREKLKKTKEVALKLWGEQKITLAHDWIDNEPTQMARKMARGTIHLCKLGENLGSEQNGERPVLIVSNDRINSTSGNVKVIPLTTKLKTKEFKGNIVPKHRTHFFLKKEKYSFLDYDSAAKVEETTTVNKIRLTKHLGQIDQIDMDKIMSRLKWVYGI